VACGISTALNNLTPAARLAAAREVTHGLSFQLDWAYHEIGKPPFGRKGLEQKVITHKHEDGRVTVDDEVSFNTQSGSQWDGFMHYTDPAVDEYYNGVKHSDSVLTEEDVHSVHCKATRANFKMER
jgi:hypothetical protein